MKPLAENAVVTAEAPGRGITSISFFTHSLINFDPGSEIAGVPASEIKEIRKLFFKRFIIFDKFWFH